MKLIEAGREEGLRVEGDVQRVEKSHLKKKGSYGIGGVCSSDIMRLMARTRSLNDDSKMAA